MDVAGAAPECGGAVSDRAPLLGGNETGAYEVHGYEVETDDTVFLGGKAYDLFAGVPAADGYQLIPAAPAVAGAELTEYSGAGVLMAIYLKVTAEHYTDETSEITETVLTPATATADGVKQICVYCAGGCGEIAETRTEVIPATGEAGSGDGACPYCGENHDKTTVSGWWISFLHDFLFIITRLLTWWK